MESVNNNLKQASDKINNNLSQAKALLNNSNAVTEALKFLAEGMKNFVKQANLNTQDSKK